MGKLQMEQNISAAEANRSFSTLLRQVREGHSFVVTSHGKPVARLIPADASGASASEARTALFDRLEKQPVLNIPQWSREELYDRGS
jgi:prevent-host-death family protein